MILYGRSSSHFTRVARMFADELAISYRFEPVFDLASTDIATYAGNPALKLPILVNDRGHWFGSINICREFARRSGSPLRIVWPEDHTDALTSNALELTLQAMATEVMLIMQPALQHASPASKPRQSLMGSVAWLDSNLPAVLAALPGDRELSVLEVALYCFATHLGFRQVLAIDGHQNLQRFVTDYGTRRSAQRTAYAFDVTPT